MFKENKSVLQKKIFGISTHLSDEQNKKILNSKENYFFRLIVCSMNEKEFKPLFVDDYSRPNSPINILVGALVYKEMNNWTFKELCENLEFNILTKIALGLDDLQQIPFCYTTIFNFKNRVAKYNYETGTNLFEKVFDGLTEFQLKQLKIKTNLQRADTTMFDLNIRSYSRLELLTEILIRLHRDLSQLDKQNVSEILSQYVEKTAQKQVYEIKSSDIPHQIEKISQVYFKLIKQLQSKEYEEITSYKNFVRVFNEHFIIIENAVTVKDNKELNSSILQSPDAPDATYRNKRNESYHGLDCFVSETCSPENPIQLITDIAVYQNNVDDTIILNERVEIIKEKTPELSQLHTDGGFGNTANDNLLNELNIVHVQTAIRGRHSNIEIKIEQNETEENYTVICPNQTIESRSSGKNMKAIFDKQKCKQCPLFKECRINKADGIFYFKHEDYLANKRKNVIQTIPIEQRKLRPNVEATVKELVKATNGGKLRIRNTMSVLCYAFNRAISINFGRIYRYICKPLFFSIFASKKTIKLYKNNQILMCFFKTMIKKIVSIFLEQIFYNKITNKARSRIFYKTRFLAF